MPKKRLRSVRRELLRAEEKLATARQKLAQIEPGGTPERPMIVSASPVIDVRARSLRCLRCQGESQLDDHTAETVDGKSLRVAHLRCVRCGTKRKVWFSIVTPMTN